MADVHSIFSAVMLRNLSDKDYERRKNAALQIEGIIKQLAAVGNQDMITSVINFLINEMASSLQANQRKGGLIGLAAVTVGLSTEAAQHLEQIVPPVLSSFRDQDSRVRYHACEALYNIAKAVRGDFIRFFNQIFDALCKLSADSDADVQSAAHLLDQLVKDIVTEGDQFSIEESIPLLRERMNVVNPYVRQFLLGWIIVLAGAPEIDMLGFLPDFLDGLFDMLCDNNLEIRHQADVALSEFLQEIKNSTPVDCGRMADILVQKASCADDFTRLSAITWIKEFVKLGGDQLVPYYADILGVILPCISDKEEKIRVVAGETNEELRNTKAIQSEGFDVGALLSIARKQISSEYEATRIEALLWILALLSRHRAEVLTFLDDIFDTLLKALSDSSNEVVLLVIEVLARISKDDQHFSHLVVFLVHNFRVDSSLLLRQGALIVHRLSVLLGAERIYREFSKTLKDESDLDFASRMVEGLNFFLLTSSELSQVRELLSQSSSNSYGKDLFDSLYASWCHSPIAIISLCLLAQTYEHATTLILSLGEEEINARFLVLLDKLIKLLETRAFAYLRLQLLEPGKYTWLMKVLYGLLMLLPQQSPAFKMLQTRLNTIPSYSFSGENSGSSSSASSHQNILPIGSNFQTNIDFRARLQHFQRMQNDHRLYTKEQTQSSENSGLSSRLLQRLVETGLQSGADTSRPSSTSNGGPGQ